MSTLDDIAQAIEALPPREVEALVRALVSEQDGVCPRMSWPAGYFDQTAGALAGARLERATQRGAERRDYW